MAEPWTTVAWALGPRDLHDPAVAAPCRQVRCLRRGQMSLGNRLCASHGRRPQRQRGPLRAAAWADYGGWDRAGASACCKELSTQAGENGALGRANCCRPWGFGMVPAGEAQRSDSRGEASVEG